MAKVGGLALPKVSRRQGNLLENLMVVSFAVLATVGIFRHEIWRDEAQAWLLARDSASMLDLFRNSRYEGHPLLWHYCLYGLSRLTHSVRAMQGLNLLIAIASSLLLVKRSPFALPQRGLLVFGYFFIYEYTLLSRSYGMGVFLVFLFCTLYCRRQPGYWGLTAVLILLANTSIFGLLLSFSLAIALFYRLFFLPMRCQLNGEMKSPLRKDNPQSNWLYYSGALLLGWGFSVCQIARAVFGVPETYEVEPQVASSWIENTNKLFQITLKSYLPMPNFRFHFWNGHLLEDLSLLPGPGPVFLCLSGVLSLLVLLLAIALLRKTPVFLMVYGFGMLSMGGLFVLVYRGSARHYGHLFVLLLACLWLSRGWLAHDLTGDVHKGKRQVYDRLFTGVLCLQVFSGVYAYTADIRLPFSTSYAAAAQIERARLDDRPLIGINQRPVSSLSAYLNRPIYYPEAERFGSFWEISYPEVVEQAEIVRSLETFAAQYPAFVAILTQPLDESKMSSDLIVRDLEDIRPGIVETESFSLYAIERRRE